MTEATNAFLPFPPTPDRDSRPWWDGLAAGEFRLQRCADCAALRWPARAICNRCRSFESVWEVDDGAGRVASWVRTHQAFAPALRDAVPYTVVQVELDAQEDLQPFGAWLAEREPVAGEAVVLEIVEGADGYHFPCWRPARP